MNDVSGVHGRSIRPLSLLISKERRERGERAMRDGGADDRATYGDDEATQDETYGVIHGK